MTGLPNNQPGAAPVKSPRKGRYDATRVANFKRLIELLRTQSMNRSQASEALGITKQNASKYFCDLAKHGVTICASDYDGNPCTGRRTTHCLVQNDAVVDLFLATLDLPRRAMPTKVRATGDANRHFHLIFSGAMVHQESAAAPGPDPLALPASFFRASTDSIPAPARATTEPEPAATGFAALDVHFVRLPVPVKAKRKTERRVEKRTPDYAGAARAIAALAARWHGGLP